MRLNVLKFALKITPAGGLDYAMARLPSNLLASQIFGPTSQPVTTQTNYSQLTPLTETEVRGEQFRNPECPDRGHLAFLALL